MRVGWFKAPAVAGSLLGVLVERALTYRYAGGHVMIDDLSRLAGQHISSLENGVRLRTRYWSRHPIRVDSR